MKQLQALKAKEKKSEGGFFRQRMKEAKRPCSGEDLAGPVRTEWKRSLRLWSLE